MSDLLAAIDAAEAEALRQHEAGTCHLSEWSCPWCETENSGDAPSVSDQLARVFPSAVDQGDA